MLQVWFQQGMLKVAHLGPLQRFDHFKGYNEDSDNNTDEKEEHSNVDESNVEASKDREPNEKVHDSENNIAANSDNDFETQKRTVEILLHLQNFLSQGNIHLINFKLLITYFKGNWSLKEEEAGLESSIRESSWTLVEDLTLRE